MLSFGRNLAWGWYGLSGWRQAINNWTMTFWSRAVINNVDPDMDFSGFWNRTRYLSKSMQGLFYKKKTRRKRRRRKYTYTQAQWHIIHKETQKPKKNKLNKKIKIRKVWHHYYNPINAGWGSFAQNKRLNSI